VCPVFPRNGISTVLRFLVLMLASMKCVVFWDVAPCSHVEVDRRFRGAYCLHHKGDESNRVVMQKLTDVSEVHTASIIRAMNRIV
jgi:hypothetical protein